MNILALDLGTLTGYAMTGSISGVWDFKPRRHEGGGMRYLRFRRMLDETHSSGALHAVYYEEVRRHIGTDAAHVYGGLLGQLSAWCEEKEIPYQGIPVGTIKKHATGKGNADKAMMIENAIGRGWAPADDNEADALWLLDYVLFAFHSPTGAPATL